LSSAHSRSLDATVVAVTPPDDMDLRPIRDATCRDNNLLREARAPRHGRHQILMPRAPG
jgi:hypothetical protein